MKNTTFLSIFVAIAFCLCGCSSDDNNSNPDVGAYKYEDNPTMLEGTWHLAKANFSFGGIYEFEPGAAQR